MKWLEIAIYTTDAGVEPVCGALSAVGVDQVSIEESREKAMAFLNERAVYWDFADESGIGTDAPCVKAYLSDTPESLPVLAEVKAAVARLRNEDLGVDASPLSLLVTTVDDQDWENNWKQYYKPLPVGERLLVLPAWEPEPEGNERAVLRLDPGVAFGTGMHPTTRMCLTFLEKEIRPGMHMLDLGCGSGILSIASLLLGARDAVAVDIDPVAERIAGENAEENGIARASYRVLCGDVMEDEPLRAAVGGDYDAVAANIVAGVIVSIAPFAKTCCKKGAPFIVSGVIDEREAEVCAALVQAGFAVEAVAREEGWVGILARG